MDLSERHTNERIAETPEEMEGTVLTDWVPAELRILRILSHKTHQQSTGVYVKTRRRAII